jgi:outer membrane lipoprotein-sorting protein
MSKLRLIITALLVSTISVFAISAQQQLTPEEIIKRLAENGTQAKKARNTYTYLEDMKLTQVSSFDFVGGTFRRSCKISFVNGERRESFLEEKNELKTFRIAPSDLTDLATIYQFFLTDKDLPFYKLKLLKTEKVDELNTYVFEIRPDKIPDARKTRDRFFQGQIWVDDKDFQIVKISGHSEPETSGNRSARFETYYTYVADKYWFPWQTISDDVMANGSRTKVKLKAVYDKYTIAK